MEALHVMIRQIPCGWSVELSNGRELARFVGPGARWRATRYLDRTAKALANPFKAPVFLLNAKSKRP